jgi:hypothetical protein
MLLLLLFVRPTTCECLDPARTKSVSLNLIESPTKLIQQSTHFQEFEFNPFKRTELSRQDEQLSIILVVRSVDSAESSFFLEGLWALIIHVVNVDDKGNDSDRWSHRVHWQVDCA